MDFNKITEITLGFNSIYLFYVIILCLRFSSVNMSENEIVNMKIVEEPSNYGMHNYNFGGGYNTEDDRLKARIKPANFSGPSHLQRLYGKCFSKTDESYKYEFCPFHNVTQHEQTFRWNPYNGVLGVWQEWEIINNTFTAMIMREGDHCGELYRTAKVIFKCGQKNELVNVTEPHTCNYHLYFTTPFVCHQHSMLVYPTLSEVLQQKWDYLEGELAREEITKKGYDKRLRKIFEEAGYQISHTKLKQISKQAVEHEQIKEKEETGQFDSLYTCKEEYKKLQKEIEGLRALLQLNEHELNPKGDKNKTIEAAPPDNQQTNQKHHQADNIQNTENKHIKDPENKHVQNTENKHIKDMENKHIQNTENKHTDESKMKHESL